MALTDNRVLRRIFVILDVLEFRFQLRVVQHLLRLHELQADDGRDVHPLDHHFSLNHTDRIPHAAQHRKQHKDDNQRLYPAFLLARSRRFLLIVLVVLGCLQRGTVDRKLVGP